MKSPTLGRNLGAAGLIALIATGCGDGGTSPSLADPAATVAAFEQFDTAFANPAFESFRSVSAFLNFAGAGSSSQVAALLRATAPDLAELGGGTFHPGPRRVDAVKALAPALSRTEPAGPIIPDAAYGTTWEWDVANDTYVQTLREGAPSTGVRVILYTIDPLTGLPAEPLVEVGTLDLIDESIPNTLQLHVIVQGLGGTPTYVDYTASASASQTTGSFSVTSGGYVSNGGNGSALRRLDFGVTLSGTQTATGFTIGVDIFYDLNDPSIVIDLEYTLSFNQNANTLTEDIFFSFQRPGETVLIRGTVVTGQSSYTVDLEVLVNGGRFATITGNQAAIQVLDAAGNPLSDAEAAALQRLFEGVVEVLDSAIDLLALALNLLGVGF
jgi:hypothetical protein